MNTLRYNGYRYKEGTALYKVAQISRARVGGGKFEYKLSDLFNRNAYRVGTAAGVSGLLRNSTKDDYRFLKERFTPDATAVGKATSLALGALSSEGPVGWLSRFAARGAGGAGDMYKAFTSGKGIKDRFSRANDAFHGRSPTWGGSFGYNMDRMREAWGSGEDLTNSLARAWQASPDGYKTVLGLSGLALGGMGLYGLLKQRRRRQDD